MDVVFIAILIAITVLISKIISTKAEDAVRQKLLADRLDPVRVKAVWWKGSKYTTHVDFTARTREGRTVTGHAIRGTSLEMFYDTEFHRLEHLQERLVGQTLQAAADEEPMDLETRIRFETNQRLEKLQGDREAFLANDTNADGVVDADEWDEVRARIEAEVRAELTGAPTAEPAAETAAPETVSEVAPEPAPEPEPEPEPDGHW